MKQNLKIGDWINSYSKGIFRVEKIIERYYDESEKTILGENKIGDKYKDRIIISKKFLNSKFKKNIGYESCSEFYVSELTNEQRTELDKFLSKSPETLNELEKYEIPTEKLIYNYNLKIENNQELEKVKSLIIFINLGQNFMDIENEMLKLDILKLKPKNFGNYILQFCNYNNEYINKKKIWRDAKLLEN